MSKLSVAGFTILSSMLMSCAAIKGPTLGDGISLSPGWSLGYLVSGVSRVFIEDNRNPAQISAQIFDQSWQFTYQQFF